MTKHLSLAEVRGTGVSKILNLADSAELMVDRCRAGDS